MINIPKHFILWWVLTLLFAFLLQTLTIGYVPGIGQDEVQITDYGRLAAFPYSDWSMTWLINDNKPLLLWSYLGPLIAETAWQIGGNSGIGPRIASLMGGLAAASIALGWLLSRRVPGYVAFCLSLAFLLDPLFTLSQRMGRSDSWVIALCLGSCWLLNAVTPVGAIHRNTKVVLAGILAATATLVWPSAILLYPLILLELWQCVKTQTTLKERVLQLVRFMIGGICITILLLIPIRENLYVIFGDMQNMLALNVDSSASPVDKIGSIFSFNNWFKLIKTFLKTFSPFLPLAAVLSLFYRGHTGLKLVTLLTIFIIFSTLIYELRLLYMLPYFLALGGGFFTRILRKSKHTTFRRLGLSTLLIIVGWSVMISVLIRSGFAFVDRDGQDRNRISYAAESYIGQGHHKVFLAFTYEFYFAGRQLGWELYTPYIEWTYDSLGNWKRENDYQPRDKFIKLLTEMDYAIFPTASITDDLAKQLTQAGLVYKRTISISNNEVDLDSKVESRNTQILLSFLLGYKDYGPYLLYGRKGHLKADASSRAM